MNNLSELELRILRDALLNVDHYNKDLNKQAYRNLLFKVTEEIYNTEQNMLRKYE